MHKATRGFWSLYHALPQEVRQAAGKQFGYLKSNQSHSSVQFKKVGMSNGKEIWSARVTLKYRALAYRRERGWTWFWIGEHAIYEVLIG